MSLRRRQFLILSGLAGGFGFSTLVKGCGLSAGSNAPTPPSPVAVEAPATPTSPPLLDPSPAPQGLFAPPRGDVRLVVISDMNSQYGSTTYEPEVLKAIELIPAWKPDLVIESGDMVGGQYPSLSQDQLQAMWTAFDQTAAAPLRRAKLPYGFTLGNHDASGARSIGGKFLFAKERAMAAAFWRDPQHDPGVQFVDRGDFPFYYSFQQNDIFYLVWDASTSKIPDAQLAWADQSLASATAQQAKLRIVIGHLPLYAVAIGRNELGEVVSDADQVRALLERHRVHTYISGHHHAYYPGYRGKLQLLHSGALGSGPRPLLDAQLPIEKTLTVVDINLDSADTLYTTYNMTSLAVVDHRKLPRIIVGANGLVLRRDVQWEELTAAEKALCNHPNPEWCSPA